MALQALERILRDVRTNGTHLKRVTAASAVEKISYDLYAHGDDLWLIQRATRQRMETDRHRPCAIIPRRNLRIGRKGMFVAVGSSHFGAFVTPLVRGFFGKELCRVPKAQQAELIAAGVIFGNITAHGLELYQRTTPFPLVMEADTWLQQQGLGLDKIIYLERTREAISTLERLGQVWRITPRCYSQEEMRTFLVHTCQRRETFVHYYMSVRAIHWLTYFECEKLLAISRTQPEQLRSCLREWVALTPGAEQSAMRRVRYPGHYVIDFFGVTHATSEHFLVPALERLLEGTTLGRMNDGDLVDTFEGIVRLYRHCLVRQEFAEPETTQTIQALYACVADDLEDFSMDRMDFDARRFALPGVTFHNGVPTPHPGADERTLSVVEHLRRRLSLNEHVEYINIYDLRSSKDLISGKGKSREIVFKTNRTPVPLSYVQKRLGSVREGYADYMLTRANLFRSLGADYPQFQLLASTQGGAKSKAAPFFIRSRCPGNPLAAIPPALFREDLSRGSGAESTEVVLKLAELYGSVAAQNLAVKKYVATPTPTCRFGMGKEIFEFVYDPFLHRPMPTRAQGCSLRGTMGWPNYECSEVNLQEAHRFYLKAYAAAAGHYWEQHKEACTLNECVSAFFDGFERKIEAMNWAYQQQKQSFDSFNPELNPIYHFREKFDFALWSLQRAAEELPTLREHFLDYVRDCFIKV